MNLQWLNLVTDYLNPYALDECVKASLAMRPWVQGILAGVLILLTGAAVIEWIGGLYEQRSSRVFVGLSCGFSVCFVILRGYTALDEVHLLLYSLLAGVLTACVNAFLERVFRGVTGFLFGDALAFWLLPSVFHMDLSTTQAGGVRLAIALGAGVLFALLTGKLRPVFSALLGGTILALEAGLFIPWEKLTILEQAGISEDLARFILAAILVVIGLLVQLPKYIRQIRAQRDAQLASVYVPEEDSTASGEGTGQENGPEDGQEGAQAQILDDSAALSVEQAEEVLVEKARELAQAAVKSTEDMRLRERYEDVAQGLYSPEAAANRLGIRVEDFLQGMRVNGYTLPEEAPAAEEKPAEEIPAEGTAPATEEKPSDETPAAEEAPETEEAKAEETPATEEAPAEETPAAEEAPETEEAQAEETPAEEAPAEEAPVAEETPAAEEKPRSSKKKRSRSRKKAGQK